MDGESNLHCIGPRRDATVIAFWASVHDFVPTIPLAALLAAPWRTLRQLASPGRPADIYHLQTAKPTGTRVGATVN
jgi:hypothetical protein